MTDQELADLLTIHCPTAGELSGFLNRIVWPLYKLQRGQTNEMRHAEALARREARERGRAKPLKPNQRVIPPTAVQVGPSHWSDTATDPYAAEDARNWREHGITAPFRPELLENKK